MRERWVCVESSVDFPFMPLTKKLEAWCPVKKKKPGYPESNLKFLDFVKRELGSDPHIQIKVFSTSNLLQRESKVWGGIGRISVNSRQSLLRLEDNEEYPMWKLHPGQVFMPKYPVCSTPNSNGCPTSGRSYLISSFIYNLDLVYNFHVVLVVEVLH